MNSNVFIEKLKSFDEDNKEEEMYLLLSNLLRDDIYRFLIFREDDNDFFDLTLLKRKYKELIIRPLNDVMNDLNSSGFKTQLSYGGSGLFIFKGDVPSLCF